VPGRAADDIPKMPDIATLRVVYALSVMPAIGYETTSLEISARVTQKNAWAEADAIVAAGGGMAELLASDNALIRSAAMLEVESM